MEKTMFDMIDGVVNQNRLNIIKQHITLITNNLEREGFEIIDIKEYLKIELGL